MLEIHEIAEKDISDIERMEREIFPDPWSQKGISDTWKQNHALILGAWLEERMIGYVVFYYVLDEGEIVRIAVDAACRRQGAAGQMLKELWRFCSEKEITRMMLDVRKSNKPAIYFYQSHGFVEDGIRKNYYENPSEDAILMSCESGR